MFPILFKIGPLTVHTYGFLLALGVGLGIWFMFRQAKNRGMNAPRILDMAFYTIIIALLGAKLVLFVGNISYYTEYPGELLSLARSGGVFQGGLAFGILFAIFYMRRHKIPLWKTADIVGPAIALGHGFGRIGCFSAGCCWGTECELPWGVSFTSDYAHNITGIPLHVTRHPVQLYEAVLNYLNFFILFVVLRKKKFDGQVFFLYIINYSIIRYVTEFFRGDYESNTYLIQGGSPYTSISFPQLFSLVGIAVALTLFFILKKRKSA
ncbi:MAG: prolipoprotein diacylglyceryl transferase [Acidobacteriota bacterium]